MSDTEPVWTAEEVDRIHIRTMALSMYYDPDKLSALLAERDALAARLDAVEKALRELHFHHVDEFFDCCPECGDDWPCPTLAILDNREDPR